MRDIIEKWMGTSNVFISKFNNDSVCYLYFVHFSTEMMEEKEVEGRKNIEKNNLVQSWQELCSSVDKVTPTPQVYPHTHKA